MMKCFVRVAFALSLLLFCAVEVFPCTCGVPGTRVKFRTSHSVFIGKVTEMTPFGPTDDFPLAMHMVTFKVEKRWKGSKKPEITAVANFDSPGMCGDLGLKVGERFLIYAEREKGRLLVHGDCSPSMKIEYAAEEVKRLNSFWFRLFARLYPYPDL